LRSWLVFVLFAEWLVACGTGDPPAPPVPDVPYIELEGQNTPIFREWVGSTLGAADVQIRARVTGTIDGIHFTEGGLVDKGALLYTIDANELDERVAAARGQLAEAETRLAKAKADVARYKPLAAINAVSKRDLDEMLANQGAAEGGVEAARAGVKVAEINRGYAEVRAPISGYIGISEVRVGDLVGPTTSQSLLNTVSQIDPIHVRFSISEREYLDFRRRNENEPTLEVRSPPLTLILADGSELPDKGKLLNVQRQVDASTGALTIEAEFPNPERLVRPGQFGRVRAEVEDRQNVVLVPQSAVRELQGLYQALVVGPNDTVEVRGIEVSTRIGNNWLVEKGLKPGDRLLLAGMQRLKPGMKIKPVPGGEAPNATASAPRS
jgi:membrane fusion protein (multidrug efflux system)